MRSFIHLDVVVVVAFFLPFSHTHFLEMFPTITGREFVRNHEVIYGPFDKCVAEKRAELLKTHQQKEKEFLARVKATTPKKAAPKK